MKRYPTIQNRIEEYRKEISSLKANGKLKLELPEDERRVYTVAQNRTLCEMFRIMISLYDTEGMEVSYYGDKYYCFRHEIPFTGVLHKHEFIEIFYVIDGFFEQILAGEKYHFDAGEFVITDQNCEHSDYLVPVDAAVFFLQIRSDYLDELLHRYDERDDLHRFLFHALSRQKKEQSFLRLGQMHEGREKSLYLLEQLFQETCQQEIGFAEVSKGLLIRLLQHLCLNYHPVLNTDTQAGKEKAVLYEIERYIRLHYSRVTSSVLEQEFHYHRNYYNLLLQKYRGCTFKNYLLDVRLKKADELLRTTTLPIKEIIQSIGYENTSHFYHLYEQKFGHAPRREE